jgi:membrane-bound lytic murein transglycosylase A
MNDAAGLRSSESGGLDERLQPVEFAALPGWRTDDHSAALRAFRRSALRLVDTAPKTRRLGISGVDLQASARAALAFSADCGADEARSFFERHFKPYRISVPGFATGYYEPEVAASTVRTPEFPVPLYRRPDDLVDVHDQDRPAGWDRDIRFARRTSTGLKPYFDRAAIEAGALAGRGLELAWLPSIVDAFFVHIQGSARLTLASGQTMRVSFDGKSGHAYTSIGRLAVERGLLALDEAHKEGLEAWLRANPLQGLQLMRENRSFIFFRTTPVADEEGPLGAAGVSLTAGRSLAVDRTLMTFHVPVWVHVSGLPDPGEAATEFRRLMIAQDTGSAIIGAARGDLFFGSGHAAGALAGRVRHAAEMSALVPKRTE